MEHDTELSRYRFEQAERCLKSAKTLSEDEDYKGAANRSYYCVFHCMRSILALEGADYKKHSAVISHFRKEYIKTGKLNERLSDILTGLFRVRTESDYDDYYIISKDEVNRQIENTEFFLTEVKEYLGKVLPD
jgi:uncharacterized protein (UPF0332 family)